MAMGLEPETFETFRTFSSQGPSRGEPVRGYGFQYIDPHRQRPLRPCSSRGWVSLSDHHGIVADPCGFRHSIRDRHCCTYSRDYAYSCELVCGPCRSGHRVECALHWVPGDPDHHSIRLEYALSFAHIAETAPASREGPRSTRPSHRHWVPYRHRSLDRVHRRCHAFPAGGHSSSGVDT